MRKKLGELQEENKVSLSQFMNDNVQYMYMYMYNCTVVVLLAHKNK